MNGSGVLDGINTFRDFPVILRRSSTIPFVGYFEVERIVWADVVVLVDELCERCLDLLQIDAEDPEVGGTP